MLPEECLSRGRGDSRAHIAAVASPHRSEGSGCVCPCPLGTDVPGARGTAWHRQREQTLQPAHLKRFLNLNTKGSLGCYVPDRLCVGQLAFIRVYRPPPTFLVLFYQVSCKFWRKYSIFKSKFCPAQYFTDIFPYSTGMFFCILLHCSV